MQKIHYVLGGQFERETENDQPADYPKGKTLSKNIHLRHRSAQEGKNQGDNERHGENGCRDLQRDDED